MDNPPRGKTGWSIPERTRENPLSLFDGPNDGCHSGCGGCVIVDYVLGNAFKQIFELLVNDELPISLIFKMVGLLIPQALTFTMPWGILVAALMVLGRMSQDLELQAIRAAGIGLVPLVAPVILFGLFLSAVCFYNNAVVVPMTLQKFKSVLLDIGRDNPAFLIRAGEAMDRFLGTVFT